MQKAVKIFLDDERRCPAGFQLAKNAEECMELLRNNSGKVEILSLDHDLGESDAKTGYDVVKQMINEGLHADVIYLHTANGEGRKNMYFYLINAIKHGALPEHVVVHKEAVVYNYEGENDK